MALVTTKLLPTITGVVFTGAQSPAVSELADSRMAFEPVLGQLMATTFGWPVMDKVGQIDGTEAT